jgi:hypothetical protein
VASAGRRWSRARCRAVLDLRGGCLPLPVSSRRESIGIGGGGLQRRPRWMRCRCNVFEGNLAFDILASKDRLLCPLHEDADIGIGQWSRHIVDFDLAAKAPPSARRRTVLPVMGAARGEVELDGMSLPA